MGGLEEQNKPLLVTILLLPRVTTITHIICYSVMIDDGDSDFDIFSCPSSSRPTLVTDWLFCHCIGFKAFRPFRPNQNPAKLIGVIRKHDLTNKKTTTKTNTKTMTNTFREHLQRAIFETFDLWDVWSEWWGDMICLTKITMTKTKTMTMTKTIPETCDIVV